MNQIIQNWLSILLGFRWWHAEQHAAEALEWAKNWQGAREFEALDAFGFSQGIACLVFVKYFEILNNLEIS